MTQSNAGGRNNYGQLGDGTNINKSTPVLVSGINNAILASAGNDYTCAVLSNGTVKCWGENNLGQLGNGTNISNNIPSLVVGINDAISITAGDRHACVLLSNGQIKCWGFNGIGQLGNGTKINKNNPVLVNSIENAVSVSAGFAHTCVVLANGKAKCWGANQSGQLGDGTTVSKNIPTLVSEIGNTMTGNVISISAGGSHTCAIVLADNTIRCWGDNDYGQLGDGTIIRRNIPILVSGIKHASSVVAGDYFTCAVLSDGTIKCWGVNSNGELGNGTKDRRYAPVSVVGINNAVSITADWYFTCAVLSNGTVKCWGSNTFSQLGDKTTSDKFFPVTVSNLVMVTNQASLTSVNMLLDKTVAGIDSFKYIASSIPSGCSLKVQFSQDNKDWYNSIGDIGKWDSLSQENHIIDLSHLKWSSPSFYYKIKFESDLTCIPILDEISVKYYKYHLSPL